MRPQTEAQNMDQMIATRFISSKTPWGRAGRAQARAPHPEKPSGRGAPVFGIFLRLTDRSFWSRGWQDELESWKLYVEHVKSVN